MATAPAVHVAQSLGRAAEAGPSSGGDEIRELFESVARRYDLLNFLLSLGLDRLWRRRAANACALRAGGRALDVCAGTGDLARLLAGAVGPTGLVAGADFSPGMLSLARRKGVTRLAVADALRLPFRDASFDAAAVAFGIRNVSDPEAAIREMSRVVRPGGRVVVLEFSLPRASWLRALYGVYLRRVVPLVGRAVSGRHEAYEYLARSVPNFLRRVQLESIFGRCGLAVESRRGLTAGVVELLAGVKAP